MKHIENQYKDKISQIIESNNALIKELNEKNRALQTNYNQLFEKHEILSRDKEKDSTSMEKRYIDLQQ